MLLLSSSLFFTTCNYILAGCRNDNQHFVRSGDDRSVGGNFAANFRGQYTCAVVAILCHRCGAIDYNRIATPTGGEKINLAAINRLKSRTCRLGVCRMA